MIQGLGYIRQFSTAVSHVPKICIIGSGPAAFYTAQQLFKGNQEVHIDMYEKLPAPFGLVRYGVAPDHPDVKNVIHTFTQVAKNERFSYFGNVTVGRDISLKDLTDAYNATVLAYGAAVDKKLNIPGEDLHGVYSARDFVGWYNGLPEDADLNPNLDTDTAVIVGQGNVALDVARILLSPLDILRKTDIPEPVLCALQRSRVRRVHMLGRRGPLQAAFSIKELREMVRLAGTKVSMDRESFQDINTELLQSLPRPRRRLTELLVNTLNSAEEDASSCRHWDLHFLRSPLSVLGKDTVTGVELAVNRLENPLTEDAVAMDTGSRDQLSCGLLLRSIGYRSLQIDPTMPFDQRKGVVPNTKGRVTGQWAGGPLYCVGWIKRGPVGVILSTMSDAVETGHVIRDDLADGKLSGERGGQEIVLPVLRSRGVQPITFEDWERIDAFEVSKGSQLGKPREKLTKVQEMLAAAFASLKRCSS